MIKADRIYFDMDGVLADFNRGVLELCGMDKVPQDEGWTPENDDLMWEKIRQQDHFYDRLEIMPGAKEMFDMVYSRYGDRCQILTGIPKPKRRILTAAEDKVRWMHRLFSEDIVVHTVTREEKPDYCHGKGDILIDDLQSNIKAWEEDGGTGIHHISPKRTIESLKQIGAL